MKSKKFIINSDRSDSEFIREYAMLLKEHKYVRATLSVGKDRSLEQNALLHKWFGEVSEQRGDCTPGEVKMDCKRRFFIPILRGDDEAFNAMMKDLSGMAEDAKLKLIELLPVTSICTVKQMRRGMDDMFMTLSADGVVLTDPAELDA